MRTEADEPCNEMHYLGGWRTQELNKNRQQVSGEIKVALSKYL